MVVLRHDHARGAQHDVADPIAALHDLRDVPRLDALRRLGQQRLVDVRVERPVGGDLLDALRGEHAGERILRHANAFENLGVLMVLGGVECALEVVEHGQELCDDTLAGAGEQLHLLARDALAVVVEVGRDAAQVVHRLLVLALRVLEPSQKLVGIARGLGGRRAVLAVHGRPLLDDFRALVRHDAFAASSSSMTS